MRNILKEFEWKHYFIASVIVSVGAFFIHIKQNSPPDFNSFFMWLPVSWFMVFLMALGFSIFLSD